MKRAIHFLGYRLPGGKQLIVNGDTGDFTGAGMCGGHLIVNGSTGDWCGAGMTGGLIRIRGNAGRNLGQWMHGGSIGVDGKIGGIGEKRYGGRIGCNEG